jgi:cytochrome P450
MIATAILLFGAGFETTTNLLGNGLNALLAHPDQLALLRERPALIPGAVEEMLRYDSPVQLDGRSVLEPSVIAGTELAPGKIVILLLGGANRDPARFADPDRFDICRDAGKFSHLAFAAGIHFCLGAQLARLEARIVFARLLARYPSIELAGKPERRTELSLHGFARLPLVCNLSRCSRAQTTFPPWSRRSQPHRRLHDATTCRPRPFSV